MKPWPKAILDAYPLPPRTIYGGNDHWKVLVLGRPWWWMRSDNHFYRRDGKHVARLTVADPYTADTVLFAAMAEIDVKNPLPHPGFRVGQVWADAEGRSTTLLEKDGTLCIFATRGRVWDRYDILYLVHDAVCPWLAPWAPAESAP